MTSGAERKSHLEKNLILLEKYDGLKEVNQSRMK
jgi:hypothetical protein